MKQFMDKDFLLSTETAKALYHQYAATLPVIDYHCHVPPKSIAENKQFANLTELWLGGDHYKWRAMRSNGVDERYCTGADTSDWEKFEKYAEVLGRAIGNPLHHWSHLELKRYFGYEGYLNGETAEEVWNLCNAKLQEDSMSVRNIIRQSNVTLVSTTDDPLDTLEWHEKIAADETIEVVVGPSYRPDRAVNIHKGGWKEYLALLAASVGKECLPTMQDVLDALLERLEYFVANGCKATDHGLDYVPFQNYTVEQADTVYQKALRGEKLTTEELRQLLRSSHRSQSLHPLR